MADTHITPAGAEALARAAEDAWAALHNLDLPALGSAVRRSFEAQIAMFPNMVDAEIMDLIGQYRDQTLGWKLSGAGGGGYLVLVADKPVERAIQIKIRRKGWED